MKAYIDEKNGELLKFLVSVLIISSTVLLYAHIANALPPIATEFYGAATLNITDAPAGVNITAYDQNNNLCGSFIVINEGHYGALSCNGDDTSTGTDEGASDGETIIFYINGTRAATFGNATWKEGIYQFVNLTTANFPPTFGHNFTPQVVNESSTLTYDVNCTDMNPTDTISYYDNTTMFNINSNTGLISWIPGDSDVGNHSVLISCSDGKSTASAILNITVYDVNNPPFLFSIGSQIAVEKEVFALYLYANDSDRNDNLSFTASTSLFSIVLLNNSAKNTTGLINFTPTLSQVGNHTINISISDGKLIDYEVISFRIVRGPFCGDNACGNNETCDSCAGDCGSCPAEPAEEGAGAGEGAGTGAGTGAVVGAVGQDTLQRGYSLCHEKWECASWNVCSIDGFQIRTCKDINKCSTTKSKPNEVLTCVYIGTCFDGIKNQNEEGIDCDGVCEPCRKASCTDGIQNQGEEGIDCSGPCNSCEIKKFAQMPTFERVVEQLTSLAKKFPWVLVIIISAIILGTIAGDKIYVRHITKKEFEVYRKKLNKYRQLRKKLYKFIIILAIIMVISSVYIYLFSDNYEALIKYIPFLIILLILISYATVTIIRKYVYYDYRRKKKEAILEESLKKRIRHFNRIQDKILFDIIKNVRSKIYNLAKNGRFADYAIFYNQLKPAYEDFANAEKIYKEKSELESVPNNIKEKINTLINEKTLSKTSKSYPEFGFVVAILKNLGDKEVDTFFSEEELMSTIIDISMPHMRSIIKSDSKLVSAYNTLVDIYVHYKNNHTALENKEQELTMTEKSFLKKIQTLSQDSNTIAIIRNEPEIVAVYNNIVEIYDSITKKHESIM